MYKSYKIVVVEIDYGKLQLGDDSVTHLLPLLSNQALPLLDIAFLLLSRCLIIEQRDYYGL